MSNRILEIQDMTVGFQTYRGYFKAIENLNLTIREGEILALVGESGCGKSVTAKSVMGLLGDNAVIEKGTILYNGNNLLEMSSAQLDHYRGKKISMIFQESIAALDPIMTVRKQMFETLRRIEPKKSKAELEQWMIDLLQSVHIRNAAEVASNYPQQLSGGMCQRVMIAMAMSANPRLLIADEPTTALDVTVQRQILSLLKELSESRKSAVLLITHDMGVVAQMADRIAVMYCGQIVEQAEAVELFENPLHPYTQALLKSVPSVASGKRLTAIEGMVPDMLNLPEGCRFSARCSFKSQGCHCAQEFKERRKNHFVRCDSGINSRTM